MEIKILN